MKPRVQGAARLLAPTVVVLLVTTVLSGCFTPAADPASSDPVDDLGDLFAPPGLPISFEVVSRTGGKVQVDALGWFPVEAATVLLAIPGSGGCRLCWEGLGVTGYHFAPDATARDRAVVLISLPGYGASEGARELTGFDDWTLVIDQVTDALRVGAYEVEGETPVAFKHVVGIGISWGGALVSFTQGLHASFDAIVPLANSHGGFSKEYNACGSEGDCPEDWRSIVFYLPNMDPRILDALENGTDGEWPPDSAFWTAYVYYGCPNCVEGDPVPVKTLPQPNDITRTITVPVLAIIGLEDFFWDQDAVAREGDQYPNADFTLIRPESTGHSILLHRNHEDVRRAIHDWLDGHVLRLS